MSGRFTRAQIVRPTAQIIKATPDRYQSQVAKAWEAQQIQDRHKRHVALFAACFCTTMVVMTSVAWLMAHIPQ